MDDKKIISLSHISKFFKLYNKPTDRVRETFNPSGKQYHTKFTALDDISLDILQGETIGVIGRNGSGKSTLLQVICGILTPTGGTLSVTGRISALLELGAGFNPEFTGRENVYLNASILGLKKTEIDDCFDKIAAFADIGMFIDRPVKNYSSGMYVRLAFAVAINVNPNILIVDEALAVGDTLFQAKCFEKFREFQAKGVTILFVTHSLDLIIRYCSKALLLDRGSLITTGEPRKVVDTYNRLLVEQGSVGSGITDGDDTTAMSEEESEELSWGELFQYNPNESRYGNGKATIIEVGIFDLKGVPAPKLMRGDSYCFKMRVKFHEAIENPIFSCTIRDVKGVDISGTNTHFQEIQTGSYQAQNIVEVEFEQKMILSGGAYLLSFGCAAMIAGEYVVNERRYDLMSFEVMSSRANVGFVDMESRISFNLINA